MGFLTDNANKSFNKLTRRAYVPEWWSVAAIAALVVVGIGLLVSFLSPAPVDPQAGPTVVAPTEQTTEPSQEPSVNDPLPTDEPVVEPDETEQPVEEPSGDTGETVVIGTITGESTTISKGALDQAQAASLALFTGNWDSVRLPVGTPAPGGVVDPSPVIGAIRTSEIAPSSITFVSQVSLSNGEVRTMNVTVVQEDAGWTYYPTSA